MAKLYHTAAEYFRFMDTFRANPTNCAVSRRHAIRLHTLALIAQDRGL